MLMEAGEPVGPDVVAPVTVARDRPQLEAERRHLFVDLHGVRTACTDCQPAASIGAQIRLVALVDELLQSGPRSVAVQDVIERLDSRRVGGTSGEQVAIAGPRIEQGKQLIERDSARSAAPLRRPLPLLTPFACTIAAFTVLEISIMLPSAVFMRLMRAITLSIVLSNDADRRKLRVQADGDAAIDAEAGISRRIFGRCRADAAGRQIAPASAPAACMMSAIGLRSRKCSCRPHICISASNMSFTAETTRALAA